MFGSPIQGAHLRFWGQKNKKGVSIKLRARVSDYSFLFFIDTFSRHCEELAMPMDGRRFNRVENRALDGPRKPRVQVAGGGSTKQH